MKKDEIKEIFEWYIKSKHCKARNPKMEIKLMCQNCRDTYYLQKTLIRIRDEIIEKLK